MAKKVLFVDEPEWCKPQRDYLEEFLGLETDYALPHEINDATFKGTDIVVLEPMVFDREIHYKSLADLIRNLNRRNVPILILTTLHQVDLLDMYGIRQEQYSAYMDKPAYLKTICETIEHLLK